MGTAMGFEMVDGKVDRGYHIILDMILSDHQQLRSTYTEHAFC